MKQFATLWERNETRYVIVGGWNTLFALTVFVFLHFAFAESLSVTETLTLAFLAGVINSFATQRKFVWRSSERAAVEFPKFLLVSVLQYFANIVLLKTFVTKFNMNVVLSQILIAAALILVTYLVLKIWVFRS